MNLDLAPLSNPRITVVITNYNYGRFLVRAIRSALEQTYACELIVVDDGSTDDSLEILRLWQGRAIVVAQKNGGQISAYTSGLARSSGEVVIFLDADDYLHPEAASTVASRFGAGVAKVHYPMWLVDDLGRQLGGLIPSALARGDVLPSMRRTGLLYSSAPGSGNAYRRDVLDRLFPLPNDELDPHGADLFLIYGSAAFGHIAVSDIPLAYYRIGRTARLDFGNANPTADPSRLHSSRMKRLRTWLAERTQGKVVLPENIGDFSNQKAPFALRSLARPYFAGIREGVRETGVLFRSIWLSCEYSVLKKIGLSAWVIAILIAPRAIGWRIARYVCNPAGRSR